MGKVKLKRWDKELDGTLIKYIEAGLTVTAAARHLDYSRTTVGIQVKRLGLCKFKPITQEEKETIKRMHAEKKTDQQIADAIGRSIGAVHKFRVRLGLKPNFRAGKKKYISHVSGKYTLLQLMQPTRFKPGTPERADIENQRFINGLQNHPLDAE